MALTLQPRVKDRGSRPRRRSIRPVLFDCLEPRTLLSATWALRAGGPLGDSASKVAVDALGDAYCVGSFRGGADFNGDGVADLTAAGGADGYVAKYSPDGTLLWANRLGGTSDDSAKGVAVGPDGSLYVSGNFVGTATFGGQGLTLTSRGSQDSFAAKLDPATGQFLWARRMGGMTYGDAKAVAADATGVFVTGSFDGKADFGPYTFTGAGADVFVARLDASGNFQWARQMGGAMADGPGNALALDPPATSS